MPVMPAVLATVFITVSVGTASSTALYLSLPHVNVASVMIRVGSRNSVASFPVVTVRSMAELLVLAPVAVPVVEEVSW